MKILVLSNLYPPDIIGGYECGCKQVVDGLLARGHDVRVLTSAPRVPVPHVPHVRRVWRVPDVWNQYVFSHSRPVTVHLAQSESVLVSSINVHALTREIEEFEPDVVYVWMISGVGGLGLMATLHHLGIPWVWHLMDDVPLSLCRLSGRVVDALRVEVDRQLDGDYLACSRQLVDEIEAGGVRLRPRVEVVPNWVAGEAPPARTKFYRPGQTLRIVAAGQIAPHKGVDLLIQGAALLRERGHDDFLVDIYGNVEDAAFPTMVRQLGLDRHVAFKGSRPQAELLGLLPSYDVFAFPTWAREPFAFAPLEAAWRGCVPLISQICGNAEWGVHGVHCLKIERTARGVADGLSAIVDGRVDLEPLARRAAAVVGRDFHLDAQMPAIEGALARASARERLRSGTSAEAYRLSLLAEKLAKVLVQEAIPA